MNSQRYLLVGVAVLLTFSAKAQDYDEFIRRQNKEFTTFIDQKQKEFDEFRRQQNEEYARFMEKGSWVPFEKKEKLKRPVEKDIRPIIYDESKDRKREGKRQAVEVVPDVTSEPKPQPKPIVPIKQNDDIKDYNTFDFYGTPLKVRWGDLATFKLGGTDEKTLAAAFRKLTDVKYNNLLSDCLSIRDNYALCDWGYYKMLETLAAAACGKGTNEATFLHGVLYQQSGYTMRFATEPESKHLSLLVKVDGRVYDVTSVEIDGKKFYQFGDSKGQKVNVCKMAYADEQDMSMNIDVLPRFKFNLTEMRTTKSYSYHIVIQSAVNKNLLDFMKDYPTSDNGKDFMTRWAYYANAPVSEEIRQLVYPQLKERLKNTDEVTAVNMLLNWVQTAFEYEFDEKLWGHDRAFFAEEILFYPFSDCEDRAILFSHLVRDLLGLDVVLVYYPAVKESDAAHLSTAVCFKNDIPASYDYLELDRRKFTIADPCYIRGKAGSTSPKLDNRTAKIILCKR